MSNSRLPHVKIAFPWPRISCTLRSQRHRYGWRSFTLEAPYLVFVSLFSLALVAILEVLAWKSRETGGVIFADKDGHFTTLQTFSLLYLPTILAVLYSLLWSWIELDAKRLEPYFQLSQVDGASAERSLLLEYPIEYIPLVPLKAAKLRHWSVFYAASAILIVFWIITPLQSAIFVSKRITRTISIYPQSVSPLPLAKDAKQLDSSFLSTALGIVWLGENLPGFVDYDYAVEPFDLDNEYKDESTFWTLPTSAYSTDFTCNPARIELNRSISPGPAYVFRDDKTGCKTTGKVLDLYEGDKYFFRYFGFSDDYVEESLLDLNVLWGVSNCSNNITPREIPIIPIALIIWGEVIDGPVKYHRELNNIEASFCFASYHSQEVEATIASSNLTISSLNHTGQKIPLASTEFNTSNFENVLNRGGLVNPASTDFLELSLVDTSHHLGEGVNMGDSNPVQAFTLGLFNLTIQQFSHPNITQQAFGTARKLLFNLAIHRLQDTPQQPSKKAKANLLMDVQCIAIVPVFAIIVESSLCGLSLCALGLLLMYRNRVSNLAKDPASIEETMNRLPTDLSVHGNFLDFDTLTSKQLTRTLGGRSYRLQVSEHERLISEILPRNASNPSRAEQKPIKAVFLNLPFQTTWLFGLSLMASLISSVFVLSMLHQKIQRSNGLPVPTQNIAVQQLLLNYVPIAFATFLEPLLVLLNRTLCVLHPFYKLFRHDVSPTASTGLRYTALPPQLIVWRALKAGDLLLASVSCVILLLNVLAISLSNLFVIELILLSHDQEYQPRLAPIFSGNYSNLGVTFEKDHLYIARANLTDQASLPPWTTSEFSFLPVNIDATSTSLHEVSTVGFGIDPNCQSLKTSDLSHNFTLSFEGSGGGEFDYSASYSNVEGANVACALEYRRDLETRNETIDSTLLVLPEPLSSGRRAVQFGSTLQSYRNSSSISQAFCDRRLLFCWAHATFTISTDADATNHINVTDPELLVVSCEPSLKAANFNVRITGNGQVLSYTKTSPFDEKIYHYFAPTTNVSHLMSNIAFHLGITLDRTISTLDSTSEYLFNPPWRDQTQPDDYMNFFIHAVTNSTSLYDPQGSLLDPKSIPGLETVQRLLFSILLSLYPEIFVPADASALTPGKVLTEQPRVIMNTGSYLISISILSLNLVVVVFYYLNQPPAFLPRMPTSIGSLFGYIAASHARLELQRGRISEKYRFGKFIGFDGKLHIGIEEAERVFPLLESHVEKERRRWFHWKRRAPPVPPKD